MDEIINDFFSESARGRKYKLMFNEFANGKKFSINIFAGIFAVPWVFLRGILLSGFVIWLGLGILNRILYSYIGIDDMILRGLILISLQFFFVGFYGEYLFYKRVQKLVNKYKKQGLNNNQIVEKLKSIYPNKLHRF